MEARFPSASVTPFNIFYGVDLLEVSSFSFWMSKNTFNSALFLKDIFAGHRLLGWQVFFPFSIWKMLLPVSSRMASPKEKAGVTLISVPCQKCGFFNLDALSLVLSHWWWRTLFTVFTKFGKLWPKFLQMLFSVPSSRLSCGETGLPHMRLHGVSHRPLMLISVYSGFFFSLDYFSLGISIWTVSTMNASSSLIPIFSLYCRLLLIKSSVLFISF